MPLSVYVESSVISYLTARPSRDLVTAARQSITEEWWQERRAGYDIYISALVEEEISEGDTGAAERRRLAVVDIPRVHISQEAVTLARHLLDDGAVPAGSPEDALHIAIAATQRADFLLTWNFKHINNAQTKRRIAQIVEMAGYVCPVLCSPEEL